MKKNGKNCVCEKENSICNALLPTDGLDSLTYTVFNGVSYTILLEHAHGVPVEVEFLFSSENV